MEHTAEILRDGVLTVRAAGEFTGWSVASLYAAMERGELQFVKLGRSRRIPKRALVDFMARNLQGGWAIPGTNEAGK